MNIADWAPSRGPLRIGIAALATLTLALVVPVAHGAARAAAADTDIIVTAVGGDEQQQYAGHLFGQGLEVSVINQGDVNHGPVANAPVIFAVVEGSASFVGSGSSATATTDSNGLAFSPGLIAGSTPGQVVINATSSVANTSEAEFSLTVLLQQPATVTVTNGGGQQANVGANFAAPVAVVITDMFGEPVPNWPATFTINSAAGGGASFGQGSQSAQVTTAADGSATSPPITATQVGDVILSVTTGVSGVGSSVELQVNPSPPASATISGGNNQTAVANTALPQPLSVQVLDGNNQPPQGPATVLFSVADGEATFPGGAASVPVSLIGGTATAPALTAGSVAGPVTVRAEVENTNIAPLVYTLSVSALAPNQLTASSGGGQSAYTASRVTFTITGPATFGGQPTTVVTTDVNGEARAIVTAGSTTGTVTVTVAVAGAVDEGGSFTLTVAYPSQVSTSAAHAGDTAHVSASGLVPGEPVEVWLHSDPVRLLSVAADANGRIDSDVTIPLGTATGAHQLEIRAAQSGSKFHDIVISPAGTAAALAETGPPIDPVLLTWIGVVLIALGALALRMRHR